MSRGLGQLGGGPLAQGGDCPGRSRRYLSYKSDILTLYLFVGGLFFVHWRFRVAFPLVTEDKASLTEVRNH